MASTTIDTAASAGSSPEDDGFICILKNRTESNATDSTNDSTFEFVPLPLTTKDAIVDSNEKENRSSININTKLVGRLSPPLSVPIIREQFVSNEENGDELEENETLQISLGNSSALDTLTIKPRTSTISPSGRYHQFQRWIYAIAVVNFDIEVGQSIECISPKEAKLTEREVNLNCFI